MGFSRQEYWSGLPCPSPGDLPDPGIQPTFPALKVDSTTEPGWDPRSLGDPLCQWVRRVYGLFYIRDAGLIPGLGRSPGGGHGKPLQPPRTCFGLGALVNKDTTRGLQSISASVLACSLLWNLPLLGSCKPRLACWAVRDTATRQPPGPDREPAIPGQHGLADRLLGTNGGSLWLWCCLPQPGALGP